MTVTDATNPNNLVVTRAALGSAIATHAVGVGVSIWGTATPPPPEPPPSGPPTETGILNAAMNDSTDDIVALQDKATTAANGTVLKVDSEYMTVTDATDPNNLKVTRSTFGSAIAAHAAGAAVSIWGQAVKSAKATSAGAAARSKKK
jgi:hypothetical protein